MDNFKLLKELKLKILFKIQSGAIDVIHLFYYLWIKRYAGNTRQSASNSEKWITKNLSYPVGAVMRLWRPLYQLSYDV